MIAADELARHLDRFADTLAEYALAKVRTALELERDRHDAEIAEIHRRLDAQTFALRTLNQFATGFDAAGFSKRV